MRPLLAHVYEPHRFAPGYVQKKFNGVRALYQHGCFQSRDELPWAPAVLDHLGMVLRDVFDEKVILDGELYLHGWPLQRINGAVAINRSQPNEDTVQVEYHVFDRVSYQLPFRERFEDIVAKEELLVGSKIKVAETAYVSTSAGADEYYIQAVADKHEGIMYRLGDCPYTLPKQPAPAGSWVRSKWLSDKNNRVWHLLKRKDFQHDEFDWGTMLEGEGKQRGMLGAFGCVTASGVPFKVGSGLSDAERIYYWTNPPNGKRIKVKYLTLTSDGIPFNPVIEAIL